MSVSICLIGNSHAGAWKYAWTNADPSVREGYSVTFFASPGLGLESLRLQGGDLVAGNDKLRANFEYTSGGKSRIVCAEYDAFVLVGLGLSFDKHALALCRTHGTMAHRALVPVTNLISEDCLHAAVCAGMARAEALLKQIRSVSNAPIFIGPRPFPSEAILETEGFERYRDSLKTDYLSCLVKIYQDAFTEVAARYDAEVLWQDAPTMRYPGFTKSEFIDGSLRLMKDKQFGEQNLSHANEAFGALMLGKLLRRLKEIGGRAQVAAAVPVKSGSAARLGAG